MPQAVAHVKEGGELGGTQTVADVCVGDEPRLEVAPLELVPLDPAVRLLARCPPRPARGCGRSPEWPSPVRASAGGRLKGSAGRSRGITCGAIGPRCSPSRIHSARSSAGSWLAKEPTAPESLPYAILSRAAA